MVFPAWVLTPSSYNWLTNLWAPGRPRQPRSGHLHAACAGWQGAADSTAELPCLPACLPACLCCCCCCCRCLQVRLSTAAPGGSDTWCCQIKLRKEYDKDNRPLDPKPKETLFKTLNQVRGGMAAWGMQSKLYCHSCGSATELMAVLHQCRRACHAIPESASHSTCTKHHAVALLLSCGLHAVKQHHSRPKSLAGCECYSVPVL